MYKLYYIIPSTVIPLYKGNRGKLCAQAGHAFVHAIWDSDARFPHASGTYKASGMAYKITLEVPHEEGLILLRDKYKDICGVSLVRDAAQTVFEKPTITGLGLGPIHEYDIDEDLSSLKVFI